MPDLPETVRIATRSSELALWQARHVSQLLQQQHPGLKVELVDVTTHGDVDQTQPLREMGGTGVFTKEVQRAVLDGRAELAVHSLKDLPTEIIEPELTLAAVPEREVRWDALVLAAGAESSADPANPLACLPEGSRIGSGSLRRQAQILAARPDLQLLEIRGNLNTRLRKLDDGEYDALVLAAAGLIRLGWQERLSCRLQPPLMYPAVSQGALGLECRTEDQTTQQLLEPLNDRSARLCTLAERALLAALRAGCHAPVGVKCQVDSNQLQLTSVVLSLDGTERIETTAQTVLADSSDSMTDWQSLSATAVELGQQAARQLIESGGQELLGN